MTTEIHIQLVYRTARVPLTTIQQAAEAVQVQVRDHFAPAWGTGGDTAISVVPPGTEPDPSAWWMLIADTPDVANALGCHDVTNEGLPLGKCFTTPTVDAGLPISGVISHEVMEALLDPLCNQWAYDDSSGSFFALEASDAVQGWD